MESKRRHYDDGAWKVTREQVLDELTVSRVRRLGDPAVQPAATS